MNGLAGGKAETAKDNNNYASSHNVTNDMRQTGTLSKLNRPSQNNLN